MTHPRGFCFLAWLAAVLGCTVVWGQSNAKQLIVHIDDAGLCHAANQATIKCLESGAATSASIMMTCSWVNEFAAYARQHPEYCYGIHFTLNCEWSSYRWPPLAGRDRVPSLVDSDGYMWGDKQESLEKMKADEVEIELRAQIELAKKMQIPISHFDTHMGTVLGRPDLVQVYVKLALEYDKPILWMRNLDHDQKTGYPDLAAALRRVNQELDRRKLPVLDHLLQFYGGDDLAEREQTYRQAIQNLQPGVTQLIIHSAIDGEELAAITTSHLRRNQDYELFSNETMRKWISQHASLTSWKRLTEELRQPK
jgi:chitin disaccharide deacetylase